MMHRTARRLGFGIASYHLPGREDTRRLINRAPLGEGTVSPLEASQLAFLVRSTVKLKGAMAEVGVFKGATAKIMRESDQRRTLHLFDTFAGLPESTERDIDSRIGRFKLGQYACSLDSVHRYIGSDNVEYHPGLFPQSARSVSDEIFSLVHADVDLYESTKSVMEFFYPRMVRGGIIVSHDYLTSRGVQEAIHEFITDKPEPVIELTGNQGIIVKI